MNYRNWFLLLGLVYWTTTIVAQRDDIVLTKEKREFAFNSVKELKDGALVVRLKTNHRKIQLLEATLRSPKLSKSQRKRHEKILKITINARDEMNKAISNMFMEYFEFCPVYLMYDTCSADLSRGLRSGLFLNKEKQLDTSITIKEPHIFLVNYKRSGSDFPFDVLRMRKLKEKLNEPFPYYVSLRESWIDAVNTPRAEQAVFIFDKRLRKFHELALEYDQKQLEKAKRKEARDKQKAAQNKENP